jgi:hypothetical protein
MATDLFEQLATTEVPPPPERFDRELHDRVNRSLVTQQVVDLLLKGAPFACLHFAGALLGLLTLTYTGRYPADSAERSG